MQVNTIRIWLEAPLQAWGARSKFEYRSTEAMPTKSGVVGMLANALGRQRQDDVSDLTGLRFGVRWYREGRAMIDFHTAGADDGVAVASGAKGRLVVSRRAYLQDAAFVVGLQSDDRQLLEMIGDALRSPTRPLYLGRKSCPPVGPLVDDVSLVETDLEAALAEDWRPAGRTERRGEPDPAPEIYVELEEGEIRLPDQLSSGVFAERRFTDRRVARIAVDNPTPGATR